MKRCPHCLELVQDEASVCPHCRRDVTTPPPAAARQRLEEAMAPYRAKGYELTTLLDTSASMSRRKPINPLVYLWIFFWPVLVLYLLMYAFSKKEVSFLLSSDGRVRVRGYTVDDLARDEKLRRAGLIILLVILGLFVLFVVVMYVIAGAGAS